MHLARAGAPGGEKPVARVRRPAGNATTTIVGPLVAGHPPSRFPVPGPGDPIDTGTPGVGMGSAPPLRPQPGDVMERGIGGPAVQRQRVLARAADT